MDTTFDHNLDFYLHKTYKPYIPIDLGDYDKITYFIQSLKYHEIEETNECGDILKSIRLVPSGLSAYNGCNFNYNLDFTHHHHTQPLKMFQKTITP